MLRVPRTLASAEARASTATLVASQTVSKLSSVRSMWLLISMSCARAATAACSRRGVSTMVIHAAADAVSALFTSKS